MKKEIDARQDGGGRRLARVSQLFQGFTLKPAQTILLSFLLVILTGTILLMLPPSTRAPGGLQLIDALFTSTSAVCVTGLIVVDTATVYSVWGRLILLALIQTGGLGIMILSYFAVFSSRQRVSLEEKLMLSYMLSEKNMNRLSKRIRSIILTTFLIEAVGALLLLPAFMESRTSLAESIFYAFFHAVSAFCNAGFALFSDSLEGFMGDPRVIFTVSLLIILGGISFAVIDEVSNQLRDRIHRNRRRKLSLNSRVVLIGTGILILSGMFLFYISEHTGKLADIPTGRQYLAALFQSVTLRTAGFNSLPIGSLAMGTLLIMMVFMFIGAAQGSTAGGIKINSVAVIFAYVKTVLHGAKEVNLYRYRITNEHVQKAFLVLLFGICSVTMGSLLLSFTEEAAFHEILFETISAFATVGLSTGLTSNLSAGGKLIIITLMFLGRLGPLTILAAAAKPTEKSTVSYPRGDISI